MGSFYIFKTLVLKSLDAKGCLRYTSVQTNDMRCIEMNIAYIRVSSLDQNEARQIETLKKYSIEKTFAEKISAKDTNRPKLQEMLEFAREGDTIYISEFSRLARNVADLLKLVEQLQSKNIHLVSAKENIDTSTPTGKLMLTMLGAIAEFERANIKERQAEGIAIAKTKGVYKGRQRITRPSNWDKVINAYKSRELTAKEAMLELGLKRNTFYRLLKS